MKKESRCRLCDEELTGKELSNHIKKIHGLSSKQYTVKHIYDNNPPGCEVCGEETRYVAFRFKRFCPKCSKAGSSIAGKEGGKAQAWNKGKTKKDDPRIARQSDSVSGNKNHFWGKHHTLRARQKISETKILSKGALKERLEGRDSDFELVTPLEQYTSRQKQYLEFRCKKCGTINKKTLQAFERGSLCERCFPVGTSQGQQEMSKWLASLGIEHSECDRTLIKPKEVDIWIPQGSLAIEYNGLFWHSDLSPSGVDRRGHLAKTERVLQAGAALMHVFSDEWKHKQDIVKSMILHRLSATPCRISARKTTIKEIDHRTRKLFFDSSHISGDVPSRKAWALLNGDEVVCCLSLRVPRQKKWAGLIEIARFSTKPYTHVPGGLQRLLKQASAWAKSEGYRGILTYADRRFGEGSGYERSGFIYEGNTGIDYAYTDGQVRIGRFSLRSREGKSEKTMARDAGLGRVWGCGSNIWVLSF